MFTLSVVALAGAVLAGAALVVREGRRALVAHAIPQGRHVRLP